MKEKYVVSYGGGVDSTAMIFRLIDEGRPIDHVVFADTGGELPETYEYISNMMNFLKTKSIPFTMVFPHKLRSLYERCITRHVFPDKFRRWCTRDGKVYPIHRFYEKKLKSFIHEYIGIDAGETKRVRIAKESYIKKHYPLVDWNMDRYDCIKYIASKGWDIPLKSGCWFCPFNSPKRWNDIRIKHPELFEKAQELEKNSKHFPKVTLGKVSLDKIHTLKVSNNDDYCGNGFV